MRNSGAGLLRILPEHPAEQIVAQDAGLGFERTPDVVMIQIFTQAGWAQAAKQALIAAIAAVPGKQLGK